MIDTARLKEAMATRGVSQGELARLVGVTPAAIQQIVNGKIKRTRVFREIAVALGVAEDWLNGESDRQERWSADWSDLKNIPYALLRDPERVQHLVDEAVEWIRVDEKLLGGVDQVPGRLLQFVRNYDQTMLPTLLHGDILLIQSGYDRISSYDGIWLIAYGGFFIVRRVIPLPSNRLKVVADNPVVPDIEVADEDIMIIGKVVWFCRALSEPE